LSKACNAISSQQTISFFEERENLFPEWESIPFDKDCTRFSLVSNSIV
jgi:hypothetical protein